MNQVSQKDQIWPNKPKWIEWIKMDWNAMLMWLNMNVTKINVTVQFLDII